MGANLVCFPECFLQGYFTNVDAVEELAIDIESPSFDQWLGELATVEPTLVLGLIERSGPDCFNTAIVIRRGSLVCLYRKNRLLNGEKDAFRAGRELSLFTVDGVKVGLSICNDLNFATTVNDNAIAGAKIMACPCNNMMRRATAEKLKDEHTAIRRQRAIESGMWLLSSDVTGQRGGRLSYGPTSLIRPDGIVVDQVPLMEIGMIVQDVE
jgi:predicted amidohydrolase